MRLLKTFISLFIRISEFFVTSHKNTTNLDGMAQHNDLGKKGEQKAVDFLRDKGMEILATNVRFGHLELDIVCKDKEEIVFVEVKTRSSSYLSDPALILSMKKQRDLTKGANRYIAEHEVDLEARFDLIIIISNSKGIQIEQIQDAFPPIS